MATIRLNNRKNVFSDNANGNTIFAKGGDDVVRGNNGNDKIHGDSGNDTLKGGNGNDKLYGGSGNDKLYGNDGNDYLQGDSGNDTLRGGDGKDTMKGGKGVDVLRGEDGNDIIESGNDGRSVGQEDRCYGGAGSDTFVYNSDAGRDWIMDFQDDVDTLKIDKDFFHNINTLSGGAVTYQNMTVNDMLTYFAKSSGGDSEIDLSGGNFDGDRTILLKGIGNAFDLANDIVFI
ncbi:MAG: calcium-binding protein [Hyphomicrobiaceae bacterium]